MAILTQPRWAYRAPRPAQGLARCVGRLPCHTFPPFLQARIATSIQLSTTEQELYSYVYMLKLQPYMDERLVTAADAVLAARGARTPQAMAAARS